VPKDGLAYWPGLRAGDTLVSSGGPTPISLCSLKADLPTNAGRRIRLVVLRGGRRREWNVNIPRKPSEEKGFTGSNGRREREEGGSRLPRSAIASQGENLAWIFGYNVPMIVRVPTPHDFSFQETLAAHGWRRLPPFVWQEETQILERVEELADGSVVLLRMREAEGHILIEVEGVGNEDLITRRVRRMLQLDLPLARFHTYCLSRPELAHLAECKRGRMLRCPTLHEDALKVIATSNTTWAQTIAMTARLVEHFGAPLPQAPERRAFPTPQRIAAVPFEEFAAEARMGYRNAYVHQIAAAIAGGSLDLEAWQEAGLTAEELRKRLLSLPGIGPYGAACLMLYLGKPEHVNADSWARMLLAKELGHPVTDKEVLAFFEGYGLWRGLVYNFYPWKQP